MFKVNEDNLHIGTTSESLLAVLVNEIRELRADLKAREETEEVVLQEPEPKSAEGDVKIQEPLIPPGDQPVTGSKKKKG